MLPTPPPRRSAVQTASFRRLYEEYIEQRIEEYKEGLPRERLFQLADEAVQELQVAPQDQFVLTEMVLLDHVDRLIKKRLRLPTFRRWRDKHLQLRRAQQQPTHWGIPRNSPLVNLRGCLEPQDLTVVVGCGCSDPALFLAANEHDVVLMDNDLKAVEAAEARAASENLARHFQALVVNLGAWFPEIAPDLVLIDAGVVARLTPPERTGLLNTLVERTNPGGAHLVETSLTRRHRTIAPDALLGHYARWTTERPRPGERGGWLVARNPMPGHTSTHQNAAGPASAAGP